MIEATISVSNDGFGRSAAGLVYSGLYVQVGEQTFPNARWTDFVVIVLAWWCRALARLLAGETGPIEVRFMEGPYLVEIGPTSDGAVHLRLLEAGLKGRVQYQADVSSDPLIDSVLSASERTLAQCEERGWWSSDADELTDAMKALHGRRLKLVN